MNAGESRRAPRRPATAPMAVIDVMTERTLGRIGNLSENGMLLLAGEAVVEDALYQLRFVLPAEGGRHESIIDAGAHVVWLGRANAPGHAFAGLRFLTLSPQHRQALRDWVAAGAAM